MLSPLKSGRLASLALQQQVTGTAGYRAGPVALRSLANWLERNMLSDPDSTVHWIAVVDEADSFGPPTRFWSYSDHLLQVSLAQGFSEGMLIYVHAQANRYKPGDLVPLLRIKVLCGNDRIFREMQAVWTHLNSPEFDAECNASPVVARRFDSVAVGEAFFDPKAGEQFRKVDATSAECLSGGDALTGIRDTFAPDDVVHQDRGKPA